MRETFEFRIPEPDATLALGASVGRRLPSGLTRVIEVSRTDPVYERIRRIHLDKRRAGLPGLFTSWQIRRRYSAHELAAAEILQIEPIEVFEPAGEECGTVYDDETACSICGSGRTQASTLSLDLRRRQPTRDIESQTLPRGRDIARSIAGEIVVSDRLVELLAPTVTGISTWPIRRCRAVATLDGWRQLSVDGPPIEVVSPTVFGIDPFDLDLAGEYRCPRGHVAGLNVLSEPTVARESWHGADLFQSRQMVGRRVGLLVPTPLLFASARLYAILRDHSISGLRFSVAHLTAASTNA